MRLEYSRHILMILILMLFTQSCEFEDLPVEFQMGIKLQHDILPNKWVEISDTWLPFNYTFPKGAFNINGGVRKDSLNGNHLPTKIYFKATATDWSHYPPTTEKIFSKSTKIVNGQFDMDGKVRNSLEIKYATTSFQTFFMLGGYGLSTEDVISFNFKLLPTITVEVCTPQWESFGYGNIVSSAWAGGGLATVTVANKGNIGGVEIHGTTAGKTALHVTYVDGTKEHYPLDVEN